LGIFEVDALIKCASNHTVNENMRMKTKKDSRGGKREGAGRPSQGKAPYNVTLTSRNVKAARSREANLSALLDRLLADWLAETA
jgi:Post-segregation antitoxin CcdA